MRVTASIRNAAILGWILSAYAVFVEYKMEHRTDDANEDEFRALCDIDAIGASCSSVFTLPQGHMLSYFGLVSNDSIFNVPNALLGMVHYSVLILSNSILSPPKLFLDYQIVSAMTSSVFLAYQLTFVLFELCLLCWMTHVINTFVIVTHFFFRTKSPSDETKTKTA